MKSSVRILTIFLATLFIWSSLSPAFGDPAPVTASKEIPLPAGFAIKVVYTWDAVMLVSERNVQPSASNNLNVQLSGGQVTISFFVPSPVNRWFDAGPFDFPIGSKQNFDIPTPVPGVSVRVVLKNSIEASPSVSGLASISPSALLWDSAGSKALTVSVPSDAKDGDRVTISVPLLVRLTTDITATVLGILPLNLSSFDLGSTQASPTLTEELLVVVPFDPLLYIIGVVAVAAVIGIVIFWRKSQLSTTRKILRIMSVGSGILGVVLLIVAIYASPSRWEFTPAEPESLISGESNYFRVAWAFFGFVMIYIGYRAFKYIPKSEREKELIDDTY